MIAFTKLYLTKVLDLPLPLDFNGLRNCETNFNVEVFVIVVSSSGMNVILMPKNHREKVGTGNFILIGL